MTDQRRGDWLQTYTGRKFYPLDPRPEDIDPVDIAHALSLLSRFGGHTRTFYSVAEHCYLMSYLVDEEYALDALLHDSTEAYLGDVVSPLKRQIPQYKDVENNLMSVIAKRFGVSDPIPPQVKEADLRILLTERNALMIPSGHTWYLDDEGFKPYDISLQHFTPIGAEENYLKRLEELL